MAILPGFGEETTNETFSFDNGMTVTFAFPKSMPVSARNDVADTCYGRLSPRPTAQDNALQKAMQRNSLLTCFREEVNKWKYVNGGRDGQSAGLSNEECLRRVEEDYVTCLQDTTFDGSPEQQRRFCITNRRMALAACERIKHGAANSLAGAPNDPCARCRWDDIPSCVYCVGDRLTQGLKFVGVNLLLGVAVLVGVYFLVRDE